jgi:aspartokinase-like uncharacterized kinase
MKEQMMKRILTHTALAAVLALGAFSPAVMAASKTKRTKNSAAHTAAIKKCKEDYSAAMKEARSKRGKDRKDAETAARNTRKNCINTAPR